MPERAVRPFVGVGDAAPDFVVPMANRVGSVSLADYRGKIPLLLALFRGLGCAFCRQHIAQLGVTRDKLIDEGVDVLAITASPLDRVKHYLQYRPVKVALAADSEHGTHERYGLPTPFERGISMEALQEWFATKYTAIARARGGTIPASASWTEIVELANRLDGFEMTEDERLAKRGGILTGQFLIDAQGVVRWTNLEEATMTGLGGFPSEKQLIAAARQLRAT